MPQNVVRGVCFGDLEFERVAVAARSSAGTSYVRSVPVGMPKIPEPVLANVFYLYASEEDARAGEKFGGTGFFMAIKGELAPGQTTSIYAVTNWHVACRDGFSVIRINTKDGGTDIFPLEPHEWVFDPRYDIAVCGSVQIDFNKHHLSLGHIDDVMAVTRQNDIGVGDDVFMVGRFIDHDGGQTNKPTARFGHISLMPSPIIQPNGKMANSYCIDTNSRTGYSGSPVFVYRTATGNLETARDNAGKHPVAGLARPFFTVLGILWGQFPEFWRIENNRVVVDKISEHGSLVVEGQSVKGVSGMTCVLPAQYIAEVLNMPVLRNARIQAEREWLSKNRISPEAESATKQESDENPDHREDFTHLVSAAAKKRKPAD
jgi:hypothetical protein